MSFKMVKTFNRKYDLFESLRLAGEDERALKIWRCFTREEKRELLTFATPLPDKAVFTDEEYDNPLALMREMDDVYF